MAPAQERLPPTYLVKSLGANIVASALTALDGIAENAGVNGAVVAENVKPSRSTRVTTQRMVNTLTCSVPVLLTQRR